MCAFSTIAVDCAPFNPVKLNRSGLDTNIRATDSLPEHANLAQYMVPIPGSVKFVCQDVVKFIAHIDDSMCHGLNILFPLPEKRFIPQNEGHLTLALAY